MGYFSFRAKVQHQGRDPQPSVSPPGGADTVDADTASAAGTGAAPTTRGGGGTVDGDATGCLVSMAGGSSNVWVVHADGTRNWLGCAHEKER